MSTDLERRLRGYAAPDELRPPQLHGDVAYVAHETAVGRLLLAARSDGRLLASHYAPDSAAEDALLTRLSRLVSPRVVRDARALDDARAALDGYLSGQLHTLAGLPLDLALATPFQRDVLPALARETTYGSRLSYGALAKAVGRPKAARAVGAALGANPLCIVLPCHRVVAGSGALTGYAGGLAAKEYLLDLEARGAPTP
ncbi:MAG: methylated-DNA--[protein]-cysteine S-methyltransferase [Actinomycetota bacterium]|nr:methylated-DNA--[protein]-cysteine S-methyltransferase [Actinomycetota bacterium]